MNAEEFVKNLCRMCSAYNDDACIDCPILAKCKGLSCYPCAWVEDNIDVISIVEQWAKDHPIKTNKDVLFETFDIPRADGENLNNISFTSKWLDAEYKKPEEITRSCSTCKYEHRNTCAGCFTPRYAKWEGKDESN